MIFGDLMNCHLSIEANCPPGWASRAYESVICFGKIVLEENCLQCTVCVSLSSEEQVSVFYKNRKLSIECRLQRQENLLEMINKVNSMSECCGATGVGSESLDNATHRSALGFYDSKSKKWWHAHCTGIVEADNQRCLPCKRMSKTLQTAMKTKERKGGKLKKRLVYARKVRQSHRRIIKLRDTVSAMRKKLTEQAALNGN